MEIEVLMKPDDRWDHHYTINYRGHEIRVDRNHGRRYPNTVYRSTTDGVVHRDGRGDDIYSADSMVVSEAARRRIDEEARTAPRCAACGDRIVPVEGNGPGDLVDARGTASGWAHVGAGPRLHAATPRTDPI